MNERLTDKDIQNIIKMFELHIIGTITKDGCDMVAKAFKQLQQENKELKEQIKKEKVVNSILYADEFQQRIDKAIAYIKNNGYDKENGGFGCIINYILEILKGGR